MPRMLLLTATAMILATCYAHDAEFPVNPLLGVPGFPDCVRASPEKNMTVEDAAMDLICAQKNPSDAAIKIGCIGDSITAGVHSSGGNHTYPAQLQILLDAAHGAGQYAVTNLGACGSTMLKKANSPYWQRPQYKALTASKWDIIVIMLGTNDAKDPGDHGPNNWQHDCGGPDHTTTEGCTFAEDFRSMVELVRTLGTTSAGPKVYVQVPPPLMQQRSIGANQTVINSVYPNLFPLIAKENSATGLIDVFTGMGGTSDWQSKFPASCQLESPWKPCGWWCDKQSCDQCHPNDDGYAHMAQLVQEGLGL